MLGNSYVEAIGPELNGARAHQSLWMDLDGVLTFLWDTTENIQAVRDRVKLLTKGCKCVTGFTRCNCKRNNRQCSERCECINCTNITLLTQTSEETELSELALEEEVTHSGVELDTAELMDWVFGSGQVDNSTDVDYESDGDGDNI